MYNSLPDMSCQGSLMFLVCFLMAHVTLSFACPENCTCTRNSTEYICKGLTEIPTTFNSPVLKFTCGNCRLRHITASALVGLTQAETIRLYESEVKTVEPLAFSALKNLKMLSLYKNQLTTLDGRSFIGCNKLTYLSIRKNAVETIKHGLGMLHSLEVLELGYNKLKDIPKFLMSSWFPNLNDIYLEGNVIEEIYPYSFFGLPALRYLELRSNQIHTIHNHGFEGLGNLKTLDLRSNELSDLPKDVWKPLRKLVDLHLDRNRLSVIKNGMFDHCEHLQELELEDMKTGITAVEKDAFLKLESLKSISLQGNAFPLQDGSLFNSMLNLTYLDLKYNNYTQTPENMKLPNLDMLDIRGNAIRKLTPMSFPKLRTFLASTNELTYIPQDLQLTASPQLSRVTLSKNKLTKLSPLPLANFNLTRLDVSKNYISTFPESELRPLFSKIMYVNIDYNPIHCNCETKWLKSVTSKYRKVNCTTPHATRLLDVPDTEFRCSAPRIVSSETNISINNKEVHLFCKAIGDPIPSIHWEVAFIANGKLKIDNVPADSSNTSTSRSIRGPFGDMYQTVDVNIARSSLPGNVLAFTCKAGNIEGKTSTTLPFNPNF